MGFSHLGLVLGIPNLSPLTSVSLPTLPSLTGEVAVWCLHENYAANLFTDSAKTTPATSDGDALGGVAPLAGAVDASAATTARPTLRQGVNGINGHWAAEFNGTANVWNITGITASSGSQTFYFVMNTDLPTTNTHLFDTQTGRLIVLATNATNQAAWFDGSYHGIAAASSTDQILTVVLTSGGNGEIFRNGTSLGTAAYTDKAIGGGVALGGNYLRTAQFYSGLLSFAGVYSAAHDATARGEMHSYLSELYGITVA